MVLEDQLGLACWSSSQSNPAFHINKLFTQVVNQEKRLDFWIFYQRSWFNRWFHFLHNSPLFWKDLVKWKRFSDMSELFQLASSTGQCTRQMRSYSLLAHSHFHRSRGLLILSQTRRFGLWICISSGSFKEEKLSKCSFKEEPQNLLGLSVTGILQPSHLPLTISL